MPPLFRILSLELYERPVHLRIPFRFGDATVTEAPQAFVRARIRVGASASVVEACGAAAELMIPKWFDKSAQKTNADNIADLRVALTLAADAYTSDQTAASAFGHFVRHHDTLVAHGARAGINPLTANYGPAVIDRAILDALCRALAIPFATAIRSNLPGIDSALTPDLDDFDIGRFLGALHPSAQIEARHTVGMLDPLRDADVRQPIDDALPHTLEQVIATYGNRYFKLKLSGQPAADIGRLVNIAEVLDRLPSYAITLDGNEQFEDVATIVEFWRQVAAHPALRRIAGATLYLEQPLPRALALQTSVASAAVSMPLLIDESDATLDAFPAARRQGYSGVSSKACKGLYKSLLNAARARMWNEDGDRRYFLSAEDLTTQAGLAVQQDLALAGILGLQHVERNGHHYVNGFDGQGAGAAEQQRFVATHPTLYQTDGDGARLAIHGGIINLESLGTPDFASAAAPDWATLTPLRGALPTNAFLEQRVITDVGS